MTIVWEVLLIAAAAAVGCALLLLLRTRAPEGGRFNDGDRAAGVFGVLATGFSVLLGFIVFLAFASYDEARVGAEAEAQLVLQQYETAQFMPDPAGPALAAHLICYGRHVVHREWPALERGDNADVSPWGIEMFQTLQTVQPESASEQAAFAKWLDQRSDREDARLDRVHGAEGIIPPVLWFVLLLTAGVIFVFMLFFADSAEAAIVQAMQIASVVVVIGATMVLIRFLDDPYHSGYGGLEPVAMERTLRILDTDLASVASHAELPCNDGGDPL